MAETYLSTKMETRGCPSVFLRPRFTRSDGGVLAGVGGSSVLRSGVGIVRIVALWRRSALRIGSCYASGVNQLSLVVDCVASVHVQRSAADGAILDFDDVTHDS